jgi:hypothetical protein
MLRAPALAGAGTTLLAVLLLLAQASVGVLAHSTFVLFIIPVGALAAGAVCSSGIFLRLRFSALPVSWKHRLLAGSLGLLAFAATYAGMYVSAVFDAAGERSRLDSELAAAREKNSSLRAEVRLAQDRLAGAAAPDVLKIEREEGDARRERGRAERWLKAAVDRYNLHVRSGMPGDAGARGLRADVSRYEEELAAAEGSLSSWTARLKSAKAKQEERDRDLALIEQNGEFEAQIEELTGKARAFEPPSARGFLERCVAGRRMGLFASVRLSDEAPGDARVGWLQLCLELLGFAAGSLLCGFLVGDGKELLSCPGCKRTLRVPSKPGLRVRCPSCGREILLEAEPL